MPKIRVGKRNGNMQTLSTYYESDSLLGTFAYYVTDSHNKLTLIAPVLQMNELRLREVIDQPRSYQC